MRFLVDADLPRSVAPLLRSLGHEAEDVRDCGLGTASDRLIADYALRHSLCLLTGDFDFADIRNYPPEQYAGIVVLGLPRDATAPMIRAQVETFIRQTELLPQLPGRLAIVEPHRVRLRPS